MVDIRLRGNDDSGLTDEQIRVAVRDSIEGLDRTIKNALIIPPDFTRYHSGAGKLTEMYYTLLKDGCNVDILPALGTHMPMSDEERTEMFGNEIPKECFIDHNWREDVVKIGEVPSDFIEEISEGLMKESVDVEVNKLLVSGKYDIIISIGQVVPHEVVGMANYSKNIFVGCGGKNMINSTHMLGAVYGMERLMGKDHSPVRKVFDYAEEHFAKEIPLMYVLTVTTEHQGEIAIHGLFIGRNRGVFEAAVALSQEKNLTFVDEPFKKVVVYLNEREFKSTWLGNKAIYRTRMAIADDGDLIIIAPGVRQFGEDEGIDKLIRKYGYVGRDRVLELYNTEDELRTNQSVAAHLIHGSSDDRFNITYAVEHLTREEIEGVNFQYMPLEETYRLYDPNKLKDGYNVLKNGEEIFYISNPALGLWVDRKKFEEG
ncbi:MAG TPA: DUF2088 domain-containing protein [Clostridiales bacterium]|nr:DUF2088 domain-containing protein [Clostridiales bacterium]